MNAPTARLGEVADVNWGDTSVTKSAYVDTGYTAYSATGADGFLPYADYDRQGIVLSAIGARCGKTWFADGKWSCIKNTIRYWSTSNCLDNRYLYWITNREDFFPKRGAAQPFITIGDARNATIPLPKIDEQRRIAAILDKADALCRKREHALHLLDNLGDSIFVEMFGDFSSHESQWSMESLAEIAEKITDGEHQTPRRVPVGIKLLSARNIQMGYIDTTDVDYVDQAEFDRISKRLIPQPTDVLLSCSGTIGRASVLRLIEPIALVRSVALIRPKPSIVSTYLEHWLRNPYMQATMHAAANSSGQPNLFQNQIKRLHIAVPPLELQREFESRINSVTWLRTKLEGAAEQLSTLFGSLQNRAFSGHL